jgi:hypothetical protein
MDIQIDTVIKRARGYWFVDGFTEIAAGSLFILLAGIFLLHVNEPHASFSAWFLSAAGEISVAKFFGILTAVLILWWLKDHFTYPRTGFARGNKVTAAHLLILIRNAFLFLLLPLTGLLTVSLLIESTSSILSAVPVWFPVGLGLIWAVLCVLAADWTGLRRFQLAGGLILLAGIKIGLWQFAIGLQSSAAGTPPGIFQPSLLEAINRTLTSIAFLTLVTGVIFLLSGIVTFLRYRKENPVPYSEVV